MPISAAIFVHQPFGVLLVLAVLNVRLSKVHLANVVAAGAECAIKRMAERLAKESFRFFMFFSFIKLFAVRTIANCDELRL